MANEWSLTTLIKHRLWDMYANKVLKVLSLAYFQFENVSDHGISRYFKQFLIHSQSFIRYSGKMVKYARKKTIRDSLLFI